VTLATKGNPAATIVIPEDAHGRLTSAANDLQHYVKAICGVELPIEDDGKQVTGAGLYIGECEVTTEADMPPQGLNPETYAIRVRDGDILFTGRWPSPTSFAVSSFIEDTLGVRWFAPGDLWEYVPQGKAGELTVEVEDVVKVPGTSPRVWSGHAWSPKWNAWNLRNKTILSEVVPRRQFQNNLYRVFPPSKYGKTHPEYYPLINGKRWIPSADNDRYWRPCESNPDVLRLTVEYARKWFDDHPNIDSFSLGMDDISHICGCENCRAMDPHPDSYEKRQFSDRHYKFVNALAREIKTTHPDRYIGALIYWIARELPETVPKLEDNVFGFITETSALWWQEGRKDADHELSAEWTKRCKHLSRYDYFGMGTFVPRVYPHAIAEQIKFDKSLGFEGMYTEVYTFLPHTAPMIWAFAKLQWDHTLGIDELLGEFYAKMYGPAAPIMKQYFDLLEESWNTPRPGREGWVHRNIVRQALSISPEAVDEGMALCQKAINTTGDPDIQARIDIHRAALQYAGYAVKAYGLSQEIMNTGATDEQSAEKVLTLVDALGTMAAEREVFWAEASERQDLLGENLRGFIGKGYLQTGKVGQLERGGFNGAMKALAWYAESGPEKLASVVERLQSSGTGSVSEMVKAWLWVQGEKPDNLMGNGDFEDAGANTDKPEKDWETEGAPKGWSKWSATPKAKFVVLGGKGRNGSATASIADAQSSCYLQTHQCKPGEKYLCVCWAKADPADLNCGAKLGIRFRDEKGGWHKRRDLEPTVQITEGQEGWQPLVVMVEIPEGAGSFLVMPGAGGQEEGARVLFDDVALYRLPGEE
jgi:hypothetical protein